MFSFIGWVIVVIMALSASLLAYAYLRARSLPQGKQRMGCGAIAMMSAGVLWYDLIIGIIWLILYTIDRFA
jgi:hypothetical protein